MKKLIILALFLALTITPTAFAHPGRTDSNGGHTCKTNCSKWGYEDGEYHIHEKKEKKAKTETKTEARTEAKESSKPF